MQLTKKRNERTTTPKTAHTAPASEKKSNGKCRPNPGQHLPKPLICLRTEACKTNSEIHIMGVWLRNQDLCSYE
jgi:hypothetical protein